MIYMDTEDRICFPIILSGLNGDIYYDLRRIT